MVHISHWLDLLALEQAPHRLRLMSLLPDKVSLEEVGEETLGAEAVVEEVLAVVVGEALANPGMDILSLFKATRTLRQECLRPAHGTSTLFHLPTPCHLFLSLASPFLGGQHRVSQHLLRYRLHRQAGPDLPKDRARRPMAEHSSIPHSLQL